MKNGLSIEKMQEVRKTCFGNFLESMAKNSKKIAIGTAAGFTLLGGMMAKPADASLAAGLLHTGGNSIRAWVSTDAHNGNLFVFLDVLNTRTGALTHRSSSNIWGRAIHHDRIGVFPTGRTAFSTQENRTTGQVIYLSRSR